MDTPTATPAEPRRRGRPRKIRPATPPALPAGHNAAVGGRAMMRRLFDYLQGHGFRVGDRLPAIRTMAEALQVSPNAVRDGMMTAQAMGLVEIMPRSGAFLRSLDFSMSTEAFADTLEIALTQKDPNLFHLVETRALVEARTVEIAAARRRLEDMALLRHAIEDLKSSGTDPVRRADADEAFHLAIAGIAGNAVLVIILRALLVMMRPYRINQQLTDEDRESTLRGHEQIYKHIRNGEITEARVAMNEHVTSFWDTMLNLDPETIARLPLSEKQNVRANTHYREYLDSVGA